MHTVVLGLLIAITAVAVVSPPADAGLRSHLVQPGETLYRIALRYGVTVEALARANGVRDPALIRAGQILTIPEIMPSGVRQATVRQPAGGSPGAAAHLYVVHRGDTLWAIARRYATSVEVLREINGLRSDRLRAGQALRLPVPAAAPPASSAEPAPAASSAAPAPEVGAEISAPHPLRVRRGPKSYHTTLAIVAQGTPLRVLAADGDWIRVQLPTGGEPGWLPVGDLRATPAPPAVTSARLHGADIVREGMRYLGTPYVWGGESARGVDCSGFVYVVFSARMPELTRRRSFDYFQMGLPVDRADLRPGDLVFFTTYAPGPSHVGIYIGDGRFLQASSGARRVVITPLDDAYYAARYLGARRLLAP